MRTKAIDASYYENPQIGGPIVTFDAQYPNIKGIELPMACAKPEVLATPKGRVVSYLINYKPWEDTEGPVEKTRHCYYVDKDTWLEIKKHYDTWCSTKAA